MASLPYVNFLLATGAIVLQVLSLVAILLLVFRFRENRFLSFIKEHFLSLGFGLALIPMIASLYYSEVIGFLPCNLCWLQRIFLYPHVFLFGVALWKKDREVGKYALPLLIVGTLISLYHNFIYNFTQYAGPCDASGVSCVQKLVNEFGGYISIPSLALTSFVSLLVLLAVAHFYKKEHS